MGRTDERYIATLIMKGRRRGFNAKYSDWLQEQGVAGSVLIFIGRVFRPQGFREVLETLLHSMIDVMPHRLYCARYAKIAFKSSSDMLRNTHHGIGGFSKRAPTFPVRMVRMNIASS
jgi:hypothetical protein